VWSRGTRQMLEGETRGIPHLAKNERDVGHPALVAGIERKSAFLHPPLAAGKSFAQKRDGHPLKNGTRHSQGGGPRIPTSAKTGQIPRISCPQLRKGPRVRLSSRKGA
jgi:hypothetical protein